VLTNAAAGYVREVLRNHAFTGRCTASAHLNNAGINEMRKVLAARKLTRECMQTPNGTRRSNARWIYARRDPWSSWAPRYIVVNAVVGGEP